MKQLLSILFVFAVFASCKKNTGTGCWTCIVKVTNNEVQQSGYHGETKTYYETNCGVTEREAQDRAAASARQQNGGGSNTTTEIVNCTH